MVSELLLDGANIAKWVADCHFTSYECWEVEALRSARFLHEDSILIFGCRFALCYFNPPTFPTSPGPAPPADALAQVRLIGAPIAVLEFLVHIPVTGVEARIGSMSLENCRNQEVAALQVRVMRGPERAGST